MTVVGIVFKEHKASAVSNYFVCDVCGKACKTKAALSNHAKAHERRKNKEAVTNG